MPPEQARGLWEEVDARSDLWAVGATMFVALTGRDVHRARTVNELLLAAMTMSAPSLSKLIPEIDDNVRDLVDRALAYEKEARWPDARAMQIAVRAASAAVAAAPSRASAPREAVRRGALADTAMAASSEPITPVVVKDHPSAPDEAPKTTTQPLAAPPSPPRPNEPTARSTMRSDVGAPTLPSQPGEPSEPEASANRIAIEEARWSTEAHPISPPPKDPQPVEPTAQPTVDPVSTTLSEMRQRRTLLSPVVLGGAAAVVLVLGVVIVWLAGGSDETVPRTAKDDATESAVPSESPPQRPAARRSSRTAPSASASTSRRTDRPTRTAAPRPSSSSIYDAPFLDKRKP
jgi:hypothetical protein